MPGAGQPSWSPRWSAACSYRAPRPSHAGQVRAATIRYRGAADQAQRAVRQIQHQNAYGGVWRLPHGQSELDSSGEVPRPAADGRRAAIRNSRNQYAEPGSKNRDHGLWGIALPGGLPTAQVRKPTKPRGRDRRVSAEEIAKILEITGSSELRTIVTLTVETGMRRSELASLEWNDIELSKQTAHLPKTKTDVPRTVPLSKAAIKALKDFGTKTEGRVLNCKPRR